MNQVSAVAGLQCMILWLRSQKLDTQADDLQAYTNELTDRISSLESCMRGVASCSTCGACRGAAESALRS